MDRRTCIQAIATLPLIGALSPAVAEAAPRPRYICTSFQSRTAEDIQKEWGPVRGHLSEDVIVEVDLSNKTETISIDLWDGPSKGGVLRFDYWVRGGGCIRRGHYRAVDYDLSEVIAKMMDIQPLDYETLRLRIYTLEPEFWSLVNKGVLPRPPWHHLV